MLCLDARRCKEVAWRAFFDILQVKAQFNRHDLEVDVCCAGCGLEEEMTPHALMLCGRSKRLDLPCR